MRQEMVDLYFSDGFYVWEDPGNCRIWLSRRQVMRNLPFYSKYRGY